MEFCAGASARAEGNLPAGKYSGSKKGLDLKSGTIVPYIKFSGFRLDGRNDKKQPSFAVLEKQEVDFVTTPSNPSLLRTDYHSLRARNSHRGYLQ